jgi:nicotinamide mononucleotide adenylyltransferase
MSANLFIGRFQPPHKGHQAIFNTYLNQDEKVLIAIRDVPTDEKNPFTAQQVMYLWKEIYRDNPKVEVIVIPDIKSINYGRDVGYAITEIVAPSDIRRISATEIRSQILSGSEDWKKSVDASIHEALTEMYANHN